MLIGAAALALLAVFVARSVLGGRAAASVAVSVPVVAAAKSLAFGDKITPDALQVLQLPPGAVPLGAFRTIELAVGDGTRVAQRAIAINEVVVPTAISGTGNRLSTMGVIGADMRALTVNVTESSGVGGLVAPGDHVDVYITRTPPAKLAHYDTVVPHETFGTTDAPSKHPETKIKTSARHDSPVAAPPALVRTTPIEGAPPQPITDLLVQDVRVLAIGQNINVSSEKPELVKSATLEVTPAQVAKLTLGQSVGMLALALRPLSDTMHTAVASLHVEDLHDGAARAPVAEMAHLVHRVQRRTAAATAEPGVEVVRGGESTHYTVPNQ